MRQLLQLLTFLLLCGCSNSGKEYLKIGTGSQTGVYYAAGLALSDLVNQDSDTLDLAVESTDGSVFNINAVMKGYLDFGFAQADRQYQAVKGMGAWQENPQGKLRFICSLHTEAVTLVAAVDSGISNLRKVKGKKVSIGSPASGTHGNAVDVLAMVGLEPEEHFDAEELKASEASMMLQDGRIDAFFYTVGHPNGALTEATNGKREVLFVPITGMEDLLDFAPYYSRTEIRSGLYPHANGGRKVPTIGMRTTLITSEDVPEETVYQMTKALFQHLGKFRKRHPSFAGLNPTEMIEGGFAEMHPGAKRYFQEVGLIRS